MRASFYVDYTECLCLFFNSHVKHLQTEHMEKIDFFFQANNKIPSNKYQKKNVLIESNAKGTTIINQPKNNRNYAILRIKRYDIAIMYALASDDDDQWG